MPDEPIGYLRTRVREATKTGRRKFYGTARWRRIRAAKLARDPVCEECRRELANEVDHVDGDNRNNAATNLRSLCRPCHSRKTRRTT